MYTEIHHSLFDLVIPYAKSHQKYTLKFHITLFTKTSI